MEDNLQISDNPRKLPFKLIKKITNDFAKDRILGRGAFGTVYKGVNEDGDHIAVKVLHFLPGIDDQQFQNEFDNMKRLEHPNIVRLVGFCDETEEAVAMHEGRWVNCEKIHRALCLEYVTNGSLGKLLLSGKLLGKSWPIRYKIIKGICEGLKYLHEGLDDPIFHFDLKLDNILLDEEILPKIADFGLSRLLGEENTKRTITPLGTFGYLPPEFITNQVISKEYDIFSLGVVIKKIITCGIVDSDMDAQEFIEHVHDNWMRNLQEEVPRCSLPDADCKHAKRCMELAVNCMQYDRRKRPTMNEVVSKLKEIEKTSTAATLVPSILGHQPEPVKTLEMDTARPFSYSSPRRQAAPLSSSPMHHGHGHSPGKARPPIQRVASPGKSASPRVDNGGGGSYTPSLHSQRNGGAAAVPNYMAATESAKARVRWQSVPRQRPATPERDLTARVRSQSVPRQRPATPGRDHTSSSMGGAAKTRL